MKRLFAYKNINYGINIMTKNGKDAKTLKSSKLGDNLNCIKNLYKNLNL